MVLLINTAAAVCFPPQSKYHSPDVLSQLQIPEQTALWTSRDVSDVINPGDLRYNFISRIFARVYRAPSGCSLLFLILDAGNFHNPKVCFGAGGFAAADLPRASFKIKDHALKAHAVFFEKPGDTIQGRPGESYLVIYWLTINKEPVDWTRQKWLELKYALFNKEKTGLMMRVDIPVARESLPAALSCAREFLSAVAASLPPEQAEYVFGR